MKKSFLIFPTITQYFVTIYEKTEHVEDLLFREIFEKKCSPYQQFPDASHFPAKTVSRSP